MTYANNNVVGIIQLVPIRAQSTVMARRPALRVRLTATYIVVIQDARESATNLAHLVPKNTVLQSVPTSPARCLALLHVTMSHAQNDATSCSSADTNVRPYVARNALPSATANFAEMRRFSLMRLISFWGKHTERSTWTTNRAFSPLAGIFSQWRAWMRRWI